MFVACESLPDYSIHLMRNANKDESFIRIKFAARSDCYKRIPRGNERNSRRKKSTRLDLCRRASSCWYARLGMTCMLYSRYFFEIDFLFIQNWCYFTRNCSFWKIISHIGFRPTPSKARVCEHSCKTYRFSSRWMQTDGLLNLVRTLWTSLVTDGVMQESLVLCVGRENWVGEWPRERERERVIKLMTYSSSAACYLGNLD